MPVDASPALLAILALLGLAGLLAVAAVVDARLREQRCHIQLPRGGGAEAQDFHKRVLRRCPSLMQPYRPVPFLTNPHVETIFAALFRVSPTDVQYKREIMRANDGGSVALDWEDTTAPTLPASAPVIILLPGLTGGSHDSYVLYAVRRAALRGMRAVVFNSRATSDSPVTVPQYYSASFTGDMRQVTEHVRVRYPSAPLLAAGWSLGANIMMRYMGEEGECVPLSAAVSLCNPLELTISNANFEHGFNRIYDRRLASSLKAIHMRHEKLWQGIKGPYKLDHVPKCTTIREFDDAITIHSFGWPSVDAYYAGSSSALIVPSVRVPLLCIQALDDPIAPKEAIPYQAFASNPHTVLVTTPGGGHLGWCAGPDGPRRAPWSDLPMYEWLDSVLVELELSTARSAATAQSVQQRQQHRAFASAAATANEEDGSGDDDGQGQGPGAAPVSGEQREKHTVMVGAQAAGAAVAATLQVATVAAAVAAAAMACAGEGERQGLIKVHASSGQAAEAWQSAALAGAQHGSHTLSTPVTPSRGLLASHAGKEDSVAELSQPLLVALVQPVGKQQEAAERTPDEHEGAGVVLGAPTLFNFVSNVALALRAPAVQPA